MDENVQFIRSSKGKEMPFTQAENDPNKCYIWSKYGENHPLIGPKIYTVACAGCRSIKDSGENQNCLPIRKYNPSTKRWTHVGNQNHFCIPKAKTEVHYLT